MRSIAAVFAALAASSGVLVGSIAAEADAVAYQLTVTESESTWTFGGYSPRFQASLVPPADDPGLTFKSVFYITVGSVNIGGEVQNGTSPYLLTASIDSPSFPAGQYPVVANYLSPNHGLLKSAPITLTIRRATPPLQCALANPGTTYRPSARLTIRVTGVSDGTFTATFVGPQTVTSAPLQLSGGFFTVTAPSIPGAYRPSCSFSGDATYLPETVPFDNRVMTISASHQIAGAALYTNPAPLRSNTPTTWEVVIAGLKGQPYPTGYVILSIGGRIFLRPEIDLAAGAVARFSATSPSFDPQLGLWIHYSGDNVYASADVHVSALTAPIPVSVSPAASPSPAATPSSPSAPGSPTDGATPATSPASVTGARPVAADGASGGGVAPAIIALAVTLTAVVALAGAGLLLFRWRLRG